MCPGAAEESWFAEQGGLVAAHLHCDHVSVALDTCTRPGDCKQGVQVKYSFPIKHGD